MLVKSGMIKTLITFGIDLLLVLAMEVALPVLFATIVSITSSQHEFQPLLTARNCAAVSGRGYVRNPILQSG